MSDKEFGDAAAAPSASNDGPATLAAIEGLLEVKLNPVAASIHGLQTEFVGLRVSVDERLRAMELRINAADVRIEKLEQLIEVRPAPPTYDGKLAEQIKNFWLKCSYLCACAPTCAPVLLLVRLCSYLCACAPTCYLKRRQSPRVKSSPRAPNCARHADRSIKPASRLVEGCRGKGAVRS